MPMNTEDSISDSCDDDNKAVRSRKISVTAIVHRVDINNTHSEKGCMTVDTDSEYENMDEYIEQCLKIQEDEENIEPNAKLPFGLSDIQFYDESSF